MVVGVGRGEGARSLHRARLARADRAGGLVAARGGPAFPGAAAEPLEAP